MFNQLRGTLAPLPEADVARSYAEFGSSRMLPPAAYLDPAVFDWEQANVFSGWQCVGTAADLAVTGAQKSVETGAGGVLLVRAEDGELRAFANTCRHRGHELLPCGTSATRRSIVCPYHAWSYKLDGSLRNAPGGFRDLVGFDKGEFGLLPIPVVDWHGWLFIDPSASSGPFEDHVAGMEEIVGRYRPEDLVTVASHSYELATNWKVIVENYQECYHCSSIHPELTRISPPQSGDNLDFDGEWIGGWMALIPEADTMSLDGRSGGTPIEGLNDTELRTVMYLVGFPNLLVSLHPDYVMTHLLRPLGPGRTFVECSWAFPKAVAEREGFDPSYAVEFWDLTNRQDWAACESVQRGLASPLSVPGPLAPEEDGVYQFVSRMARAYAGLEASDDARPSLVTQPADDPLGAEAHVEHEGAAR
jgi:Rieske 2Fe-2S family protein